MKELFQAGRLLLGGFGITVAATILAVSSGAGAEPVPPPIDAAADGPPLTAQAAPPAERSPLPEKPRPMTPSRQLDSADRQTVQKIHDGNQMELQMGRLAQERGTTREVKALGKRLVVDHTAADKKIDEYLRKRGTSLAELATTTTADGDHELLATRTGRDFDRSFALQMVADHTKSVEMLQSAQIATFDDVLRDLYDQLIETQEAHKRGAQGIIAPMARR
jgi:predicted outer membrane protein